MLERVELDADPHAPVSTLSIPARQLLEVAKALGRNPRLLILDEPTSALGPVEAGLVIRIAREHAASGGAVLFVGHRLEEVREAADRVVVLRHGRLVADMAATEATDDRLKRERPTATARTCPKPREREPPCAGAGCGRSSTSPNSAWSPPACWSSSS